MSTPRRQLITSAIPYVNGVKHLGNLIGSMLPADVFARFCRQRGDETLFICGTDDHGTPVEISAAKAGQTPAELVHYWHAFQENIYRGFGLSFDHFGSSSHPANHALTQFFATQLQQQGLLEARTKQMLYSPADSRFLPDRYVEGTCPNCAYTKARGDQCENCGKVLDPTDLITPRSAISGSTQLELRDTHHLYFKQSQLVEPLRQWIDAQDWPHLSKSIAYKWLNDGLEDRGITRDIQWGVPVPPEVFGEEFRGKVFYVWFDAPIAYIAATQEWASAHQHETQPNSGVPLSPAALRWWFNAPDVTYTEFMGKDNVYFHTLSFPATLIGTGQPWVKVHQLKSFNWLTYYGGKFSTSQGIGIFTDTALQLTANLPNGPDYWRYYLLSRAPESDDSSFTWTDFQATVNKDLADVLGNFINRTLTFSAKQPAELMANPGPFTAAEAALATTLQTHLTELTNALAASEIRKAVAALRALWVSGNEYLAAQQPWQVIKTDPTRAMRILHTALNLIPFYAQVALPIIPFSALTLLKAAGLVEATATATQPTAHAAWPNVAALPSLLQATPAAITPVGVLFPKLANEQIAAWEAQFGNQKA